MHFMDVMAQLCSLLVCLFVGALGLAIIIKIFNGSIDLRYLVSEANHEASMSRFQLLMFTFVIAIAFFKLVEINKTFPDIPQGVLTLLGISASTYAVGKGISYSRDEGVHPKNGPNPPQPPPPPDHDH
jgi:hypothetical protein